MMDLSFHRKVIEGSEYLDESDDGIVFKNLPIFICDRIHDKIKTIKNKKSLSVLVTCLNHQQNFHR